MSGRVLVIFFVYDLYESHRGTQFLIQPTNGANEFLDLFEKTRYDAWGTVVPGSLLLTLGTYSFKQLGFRRSSSYTAAPGQKRLSPDVHM